MFSLDKNRIISCGNVLGGERAMWYKVQKKTRARGLTRKYKNDHEYFLSTIGTSVEKKEKEEDLFARVAVRCISFDLSGKLFFSHRR